MSNTTTLIVWNGCDSYIELDRAASRGYNVDGDKLHTTRESFTAFPAVEIDFNALPVIDGEADVDGVLGPRTLQAVNSIPPHRLLALFNAARLRRLSELYDRLPSGR